MHRHRDARAVGGDGVLGVAILVRHARRNGGGPLTLGFAPRRAVRRRRRGPLLHHLAAPLMFRRGLGSPALFAIVWTSLASAIYFSLGIVAENALGLTPLVFLGAGVFFVLTAMTYVEGASLHPERAGSTVFARYAFNELWSFIAGWAVLLDFLILIAVTAFVATNYVAAFWAPLGDGAPELAIALAIIGYVAVRNIRGSGGARGASASRRSRSSTSRCRLLIIVVGAVLVVDVDALTASIDLGTSPTLGGPHLRADGQRPSRSRASSRRPGWRARSGSAAAGCGGSIASATASVIVIYVGISLVAVAALPVTPGAQPADRRRARRAGARDRRALRPGVARRSACATRSPRWRRSRSSWRRTRAMLGLSRLAYSLATNRQIPSVVGRLHPRSGTPYVVIVVAAVLATALVVPTRPRVPRRHLRVRRDARVPDRARLDLRAALPRARARRGRTASRCRCASAAATCRCPPCSAPRWRRSASLSLLVVPRRARATSALVWMAVGVALYVALPAPRRAADPAARRRLRARRCAPSRCAPSTARSSCRSSARRSTTTSSRRRAGWRRPRTPTTRRQRRDDRGDLGLRGAAVAAAGRAPAGRAAQARARGARAGEGSSARSTRASRSRRRRSARAAPGRGSSPRRPAAASS